MIRKMAGMLALVLALVYIVLMGVAGTVVALYYAGVTF